MPDPCIKGSAFAGVIEDLAALVRDDEITRDELHERLHPEDISFLDEDEISPGFWYPMASYDRILELLVELEGGEDRRAYLLGRGEAAMKRLMDLGIYNQFSSLEKGWTRLSGRVMSTMAQVVYNFMTFEITSETPDEAAGGTQSDRFTLLIRDGGLLSNNAQTTIEGAAAALSSRAARGEVAVSSKRVSTDEVEIYIERLVD